MRQAPFTLGQWALAAHQTTVARGASKTCIDCHIAHRLTQEHNDPNE
jgi:nitrate/TMAO reductase-like tetraheme cytochrome c subunit